MPLRISLMIINTNSVDGTSVNRVNRVNRLNNKNGKNYKLNLVKGVFE